MDMLALALVLSFLLLATGVAGLTSLFWLYESWHSDRPRRLREQHGLRMPQAWRRLMRSGVLAQARASLLYPLGWLPRIARRTAGDPASPIVLLVHGLFHNPSAWLLFRRWLREEGFPRSVAFGYSSHDADYFQILDRLAGEVDRLRERFPHAPILLAGHSLGGLLVRGYLADARSREGERSRIAAAVVLGAPHQGSKLAALGWGGLARSIMHRAPLILELERRDRPPACPALSLTTLLENYVLPAGADRVETPGWTRAETGLVCHVGLVHHAATARQVARFFREALEQASPPRD